MPVHACSQVLARAVLLCSWLHREDRGVQGVAPYLGLSLDLRSGHASTSSLRSGDSTLKAITGPSSVPMSAITRIGTEERLDLLEHGAMCSLWGALWLAAVPSRMPVQARRWSSRLPCMMCVFLAWKGSRMAADHATAVKGASTWIKALGPLCACTQDSKPVYHE